MNIESSESIEQMPQQAAETTEAEHQLEHIKDPEVLIEFALMEGVKTDEGNNGIIFEIQAEKLSPEIMEYFFPEGAIKQRFAGKVLKIYHHGKGEREATFQMRAFEANGNNQDPESAKIPEVMLYREITIKSGELRGKLKEAGVRNPETVAVILMDYVQGDDLAKHIYKRVISNWPDEEDRIAQDNLDYLTFHELHQQICRLLNYSAPTSRQKVEGDDILIYRGNEQILRSFLRRNNIVFDPEIFTRLERTLVKLHRAGIFHNDVHERNIKLVFNESGVLADVYLLDFGATTEVADLDRHFNDYELIRKYKSLTVSNIKGKSMELEALRKSFVSLKKHFFASNDKKKEWKNYTHDLKAALRSGTIDSAVQVVLKILSCSGNNYELAGAILSQFHEEHAGVIDRLLIEISRKVKMRPQFWLDLRRFFKE